MHQHDDDGAGEGEEGGDQVAQPGERQQDRGHRSVLPGAQPPDHEAEVQDREGQADRERELTGEGRRDVAAVDREVPVEQEHDRGHRQEGGAGERQVGQAAERVGAHRQGEQPEDRHELERRAVRQLDREDRDRDGRRHQAPTSPASAHPRGQEHEARRGGQRDDHRPATEQADVERHDQQRRHHHVELVGGEPGVPVGGPAGDPALGEQVVAEVARDPTRVPPCRPPPGPRSTGCRWGAG